MAQKPRVIVLTDIENEPDDAQSMVRFLLYSNQWDVEGLVATTSIHQSDETAAWRIREIVNAYGKVRDNLLQHEWGYPSADHLLSVVREGLPEYGMDAVGKAKDSPGSERIIEVVDKDDPRPVWVLVWGGPNVLAQALWKVKNERSSEELVSFVSKLRVYTISDQDNSGPWLRKTFSNLFYIASPGFHSGGAYHFGTWSGISGDKFWGRFAGADYSIVDNPWLDDHVRSKGPLGAQYPHTEYLMEGDSPSFLYLIDNGLGNVDHPNWGSWGGRYEHYTPRTKKYFLHPETRPFWTDAKDEIMGVDGNWHTTNKATIWRWRSAYQNDFSARMDWTITSYDESNHPPEPIIAHSKTLTAKPGEKVELSAKGSTDPDGDELTYEWFYYGEAGTFSMAKPRTGQPIEINNANSPKASFWVPTNRVFREGTMHIMLAVTDHGEPRLTRYQRVIVDVSSE
ncbi:MAG TPA: nucleoside hydrolase-like domain-containing protein [Fodinibius sp.]|nr:nucleoside hydrolase-like domain-containing protein [Fodinibius sp.]